MSAISTLVAKFACTNLAAKFLAVNLLKMNSYIQKKMFYLFQIKRFKNNDK